MKDLLLVIIFFFLEVVVIQNKCYVTLKCLHVTYVVVGKMCFYSTFVTEKDYSQYENHAFTLDVKRCGHLGLFFDRDQCNPYPTVIEISPSHLFNAMHNILCVALLHLMKHNRFADSAVTEYDRADALAYDSCGWLLCHGIPQDPTNCMLGITP